jgi:hypothetical protein
MRTWLATCPLCVPKSTRFTAATRVRIEMAPQVPATRTATAAKQSNTRLTRFEQIRSARRPLSGARMAPGAP